MTTTHREKSPEEIAYINREGWPPGPWDGEPDHLVFKTASGFPCMIHRNPLGALCGYVAVPPGHPAHGTHYDALDVSAHGGLTYASKCAGALCHVPEPGEPDDLWWVGFDCAHSGDAVPWMLAVSHRYGLRLGAESADAYRDMPYVRAEVECLAEQLRQMA